MSLPKLHNKNFFQKKNLEAILLPGIVLLFLFGVLIAGVFIPVQERKKESEKKKELGYYTDKQKVVSKGKTIEVIPRVLQISPKDLSQALVRNDDLKVITIAKTSADMNQPHIKDTLFMPESLFAGSPNLNPNESHVFVSKDGYDSAVIIEKFVGGLFPREKNLNLEGGLEAWKKEGLPLEN